MSVVADAVLDQVRVGVRQELLAYGVGSTTADSVQVSRLAGESAVTIAGFVLSERLPPERYARREQVVFEVPAGWWETLRHQYRFRWWMRWWVARRPVRMRVETRQVELAVVVSRAWTYPRAVVAVPALGEPVRVAEVEGRVRVW